jgi:hypothetical protein
MQRTTASVPLSEFASKAQRFFFKVWKCIINGGVGKPRCRCKDLLFWNAHEHTWWETRRCGAFVRSSTNPEALVLKQILQPVLKLPERQLSNEIFHHVCITTLSNHKELRFSCILVIRFKDGLSTFLEFNKWWLVAKKRVHATLCGRTYLAWKSLPPNDWRKKTYIAQANLSLAKMAKTRRQRLPGNRQQPTNNTIRSSRSRRL